MLTTTLGTVQGDDPVLQSRLFIRLQHVAGTGVCAHDGVLVALASRVLGITLVQLEGGISRRVSEGREKGRTDARRATTRGACRLIGGHLSG